MTVGFCSGSFDPFTVGHLHVVKTAAKLFDLVIIGIGVNTKKSTRRYSKDLMKEAIEKVLFRECIFNVKVIYYEGLTVKAAKRFKTTVLVRGLRRNGTDYEEEENTAEINDEILGMDTIYLRSGKYGNISSTTVVELYELGVDVSQYLPKEVFEVISNNEIKNIEERVNIFKDKDEFEYIYNLSAQELFVFTTTTCLNNKEQSIVSEDINKQKLCDAGLDISIFEANFSTGVINALRLYFQNKTYNPTLIDVSKLTEKQILYMRNVGQIKYREIVNKLQEYKLHLKKDQE